jgi:hypothetical protein
VELVPAHPGPGREQRRRGQRHGVPVAQAQPPGHRRVGRQHPAQRHAVQLAAQVEQPAALGVHRHPARHRLPDRAQQRGVRPQRGHVLLGEPARQHQRRRALGQPLVAQRVDDHDLRPRRRQQLGVLGVPEGERRPPEHRGGEWTTVVGHCCALPTGVPGLAGGQRFGQGGDGVQVDVRGDQFGHRVHGGGGRGPVLGRGDQAQVPGRHGQRVPAGQRAQHRQPDLVRGGAQHGLVPVAADLVQHHAGDPHVRVERAEPVQQRGQAAGLPAAVHHQQHRGPQQRRDLRGGPGAVGQPPVEQPHHALDHGQLGAGRAVPGQRADPVGADQHRVQVPPGPPGGQRVVAGVDVVRADLERGHGRAPAAQRRHQAGGHGRLPAARRRCGDDQRARDHPCPRTGCGT